MGHGINTWVIKNALVLEISFTDYILTLYMLCLLYVLSSLFLAPIKGLTAEIKLSVLAETVQVLFFQVHCFQVPGRKFPHMVAPVIALYITQSIGNIILPI